MPEHDEKQNHPESAHQSDPDAASGVNLGDGIDLVDAEDAEDPPGSAELVALRDQVSALEGRLRTVSAAYRAQTDEIAAIRARLERQAAVDAERRRGEVVAALFEPTQNLRRSIKATRSAGVAEDLVGGLEMTLHMIMEAFQKLGLEEVPGKGSKFDPTLHEAIAMTSVTDPALDGIVLEVFSTGYRIGSRLIAPARVVIGQRSESAGEA